MASLDLGEPIGHAVMARLAADPALAALIHGRVRDYVRAAEDWPFLRQGPASWHAVLRFTAVATA
ncbi:tail completion protein gp17 [Methylobacterium sp. ID0610]|uniref:tail completion protein gp17 n=1 Tax=Methylobacterium carpenticola TaxID=3344827 RepID=UPI00367B282D